MSDSPNGILTGGCQCGALRYALTAAAERVHFCHCRNCQKAVGGPFAALAPVRRSHFAWTRGTPAAFASLSVAHRDFCAACGTPLTFRYDGGDTISEFAESSGPQSPIIQAQQDLLTCSRCRARADHARPAMRRSP